MDAETMERICSKYPDFATLRTSLLRCVETHMVSLDALRSSAALVAVLDTVMNEAVAKVSLQ